MSGRPLGIAIIAIVLAVSGVFQVLVGTEALGFTKFGLSTLAEASQINGWTAVVSGVLSIIVAGGMFTLAGWAWLLAVAVLVIRIVVDLIAVVTQGPSSTLGIAAITNIVISGIILWYFMRASVKRAFGR